MRIDNLNQVESNQRVGDVNSSKISVNETSEKSEKKDVNNKKEEDIRRVMTEEMMKKAVDQANKALNPHNRRIDRSVHEKTKTVMYKMIDTETKEVIREFPPKKIQDMIAKMWELAGIFVDEEV